MKTVTELPNFQNEFQKMEFFQQYFHYDGNTGLVTPLAKRCYIQANSSFDGRWQMSIRVGQHRDGTQRVAYVLLHRFGFFCAYGWLPELVDHVDRDWHNNAIDNLRPATHAQNNQNSRMRSDNKSGFRGVIWHKKRARWYAFIKHYGRCYGRFFQNLEDAVLWRSERTVQLHGEFAGEQVA